MRTDLFDFDLPNERIALRPASPRDTARMLVVEADGVLRDHDVADLPQWLRPGDQLVVNDTKVISAQLSGRRIGRATEPKIEATLIKRIDGSRWQALVRPAKKLVEGDRIRFGNEGRVCLLGHLDAEVAHKGGEGEVTLSFSFHGPALNQAIADLGATPLPPYIASKRAPDARDMDDYQTMFAQNEGAVAAPTAGLHFTPALEGALRARGIGMGRSLGGDGSGAERGPGGRRPHRRGRHHVAAAARERGARGCHDRAVRGRHRDLHHARLSLSRGRHPDDQLPFAALDAVHAGVGLLRP
jgi:S-adenosylmethionine:tRNA ribosyltransferase-isomerase